MSVWVACNQCRTPYPAESHAGLLRCGVCENRMAFRLEGRGPLTVVWA